MQSTAVWRSLHPSWITSPGNSENLKAKSQSPERANTNTCGNNAWKNNPIFATSDDTLEDEEEDDDDDVPEIIKRLSQNGLPAGKQLSDTLSSDTNS